jgi:hypothetical protein
MVEYIDKTTELLDKIKRISEKDKEELKPLIIQLADHLAHGIDQRRPEIINKIKGIYTKEGKEMPELSRRMVSTLLNKLKKEYFNTVSQQWIIMCLPDEYKVEYKERVKAEKQLKSSDISDRDLYRLTPELVKRINSMKPKIPAKDIKIKDRQRDIEHAEWDCPMSEELARLAIECQKTHEKEHNHELCKQGALAIRMARDKRFATTWSKYQAIIVGSEFTRSLNKMTDDVFDELSRWQVDENERKCRECLGHDHCASSKCTHHCHDFKKHLTTKGIKWVLNHNEDLNKLQKTMNLLVEDNDDMCDFMKMVFTNQEMNAKMSMEDKKRLMASHIKKADCDQCLYHTTVANPDWFR